MRRHLAVALLLLAPAGFSRAARAAAPPATEAGALVVAAPSTPGGDGPRAGDRITAWRRMASSGGEAPEASGTVEFPTDLLLALLEEQPRGPFQVRVTREGAAPLWLPWPSETPRPELGLVWNDGRRELERRAAELLLQKDAEGIAQLESLSRGQDLHGRERGWLFYAAARGARSLALGDRGAALARQAAEAFAGASAAERALVLDLLGILTEQRADLDGAEAVYAQGFELRGGDAGATLGAAKSLTSLGRVAWTRGDLNRARGRFAAALAIRSRLAPGSMDEADSLSDLGIVAWRLGDLEGADDHLRRCLAVQERLVPEGVDAARTWNNLGLVAYDRGDLAAAEEDFRRALAVRERLIPRHPDTAQSLQDLGVVSWKRGDLAASEQFIRRGLELERLFAARSLGVAQSLHSLGILCMERGDYGGAGDYLRQAQAIYEEVSPESLHVAEGLDALASLARQRGDLAAAETALERSLALRRAQAPRSPLEAKTLLALGLLRRDQNRLDDARRAIESAITIWDEVAPGSPERADALVELGRLLGEQGATAKAETLIREALADLRRLLPGSMEEAEAAHALGVVLLHEKRTGEAVPHLLAALEALEADAGRAGESEHDRAGFRSRYIRMYDDAAGALVDAGRPREAFAVVERSRARAFLTLLGERDLVFSGEIPPRLDAERRRLTARHAGLREELAGTSPQNQRERYEAILGELRGLARRREEISAEVRRASPRLAALTDPVPLDLDRASAALEPGALLLSYAVGEERSFLFAVGPGRGRFRAVELKVTRSALAARVRRFRAALRERRDVREEAASLGALLLGPASAPLRRAKTLVVCPDGPLHALPFAALRVPGDKKGRFRYLAQAVPLTAAASMTVYAELHKRPARPATRLLALGDPARGSASIPEAAERSPSSLPAWSPLPYAREEVAAIAARFGGRAEVYLGREATKERLQGLSGRPLSAVHLACHAFTDDLFPLDSGLVLAAPGTDGGGDGILRSWELLESVRLDAGRVVLSACETGLGKELRGEGVVGLVRAFHYAGAPSVVASLWEVSDQGTSRLMDRFYRHLDAGDRAEDALRKAQGDLLGGEAGTDFAHPYYWASFQLYGDGR